MDAGLGVLQRRVRRVQHVPTLDADLHGSHADAVVPHHKLAPLLPDLLDCIRLVRAVHCAAQSEVRQHVGYHHGGALGFDHLFDLREAGPVHVLHPDDVSDPADGLRVRGHQRVRVRHQDDFIQVFAQRGLVDTRDDALTAALVVQPEDRALALVHVHNLRGEVGQHRGDERGLALVRPRGDGDARPALQAEDVLAQRGDAPELQALVVGHLGQQLTDAGLDVVVRGGARLVAHGLLRQPGQLVREVNLVAALVLLDQRSGPTGQVKLVQLPEDAVDGRVVWLVAELFDQVQGDLHRLGGGMCGAQTDERLQLVNVHHVPLGECCVIRAVPLEQGKRIRCDHPLRHHMLQRVVPLLRTQCTQEKVIHHAS